MTYGIALKPLIQRWREANQFRDHNPDIDRYAEMDERTRRFAFGAVYKDPGVLDGLQPEEAKAVASDALSYAKDALHTSLLHTTAPDRSGIVQVLRSVQGWSSDNGFPLDVVARAGAPEPAVSRWHKAHLRRQGLEPGLRIPTHVGQRFRRKSAGDSDLKPATRSNRSRPPVPI